MNGKVSIHMNVSIHTTVHVYDGKYTDSHNHKSKHDVSTKANCLAITICVNTNATAYLRRNMYFSTGIHVNLRVNIYIYIYNAEIKIQ